jgi:hypothetical protein
MAAIGHPPSIQRSLETFEDYPLGQEAALIAGQKKAWYASEVSVRSMNDSCELENCTMHENPSLNTVISNWLFENQHVKMLIGQRKIPVPICP